MIDRDKNLKVNSPWIEVSDLYNSTYVINEGTIAAVYAKPDTLYQCGIKLTDGDWILNVKTESLTELKEYLMNKKEED